LEEKTLNIGLNLSFKKYIVGFLVIVLILSTMNIQAFAKGKDEQNGQDGEFELIKKDDNEVVVQGTWDQGVLIGTLNLETNEVTIEEILNETSTDENQGFILGNKGKGKGKKNKYKAKIHTLDPYEGKVDAVLVNVDTNEEVKLYSEGEVVEAQLAPAIPLITWGGSALLAWLAAHAASLTIAGVTAYALTDVLKKYRENKKYNYWKAWVRKGDVYVSEEALTDSAAFTYLSSANNEDINVFAKTKAKAEEAARKTKGAGSAIWHDGHSNADGYYQHYHPAKYNSSTKKYTKFNNHIWY